MRQRTSISVDDMLWRRFKSLLALEDKDMSTVLEKLVEDYLEANEAAAQEKARQPRKD
jgi:metal-responsive CopG/Arc/MetJ family transcriptional regulator